MTTTPIQNPGFCANLYESGRSGVNWLSDNSKILAANAGDFFARVWSAVSEFFSNVGQTLGQWLNTAKEGILAAKDHFVNLPSNVKIVGGVSLAVASLAGFFFGRSCGSATPAANPPAQAAQQAPAQAAQQAPAQAAQQAPAQA
ncbi:MAG: hypothetical protein K1X28_06560 [Parachlamydiales bacterium]|nr:hypothetical protein [Parachlamydiales bacterium]